MEGTERNRARARRSASVVRVAAASVGILVGVSFVGGCTPAGGKATTPGNTTPPVLDPTLSPGFGVGQRIELVPGIPGDVQAAEFTGDGLVDLVQTNFVARKLTLAAGAPDGSFTIARQFDTVGRPWRSTLGDFDGDGLDDIATLCISHDGTLPAALYVFRQGPPGTFASSSHLALDADGTFLTAAPIDGAEGVGAREEVFVAFPDAREVRRFRLDGAGEVVAAGTLDTSMLPAPGKPYSVAILDWRGDGRLDLAVGEVEVQGGEPDRVVLYPRADLDRFGAPFVLLEPVHQPILSAPGDVDGDGFDDLAIAQFTSDQALVLLLDANGPAWVEPLDFGGPTTSLVFPDLDGDGRRDACATVFYDSAVHVRRGLLPGVPGRPVAWGESTHHYGGYLPRALAAVRVPGPSGGERDALVLSTAFDVGLLPVDDAGNVTGPAGYRTDRDGPIGVETADLDGDGDLDAVSVSVGQEAVTFWRGAGDGSLELVRSEPMVPGPEDSPGALAVGDLNGDGRTDVLVSVFAGDQVRMYDTTGDWETLDERRLRVDGGPRGVALADLDGDGDLDFVVALSVRGAVRAYLNVGEPGYAAQQALTLTPPPVALLARDLDADGLVDVAATSSSTAAEPRGANALVVLAGDGSGTFEEASRFPLESFSTDVVAADFDRDGLPDLAVGQAGPAVENVLVALNDGAFAFDPREVLAGTFPKNVLPADLDGNGASDLLVASSTGDLRFLLGDGAGAFPRVEPERGDGRGLPILFQVQDVAWADLDADGREDLLMVAPESPFVWVLRNQSEPIDGR